MAAIENARKQLTKDRASQEHLVISITNELENLEVEKEQIVTLEQTQLIFIKAAEATQKKLEIHISKLVTMAISSVFGSDVYEFQLEFIKKRGKTEADLWLIRNGIKMKPIDSVGGGVIDVVSFALRVAFWALNKTTRPIFILDEPFKMLSRNRVGKAMSMMRMLSEKLKLQMIMVSHIEQLISGSDKTFDVKLENGKSVVINEG